MAQFTRSSAERIARVVRDHERRPRVETPVGPLWTQEPGRDRWFKLQGLLVPGGTAAAFPGTWSAADAEYTAGAVAKTVRDTTGQHWGIADEWILCRVIGSAAGPVFEVLSSGAPYHYGTLEADLAAGGSASVQIWTLDAGNWTPTAKRVTSYAPPLLRAGTILQTKWVKIEPCIDSQRWEVAGHEC